MTYAEIHQQIRAEDDPDRRKRLGQFVVEVVRAHPAYPVAQAAMIALQADELADIHHCRDLDDLIHRAERLSVRPESEWRLLGHVPLATATPLQLEVPREGPAAGRASTEPHYAHRDMAHAADAPPCEETDPARWFPEPAGAGATAPDGWARRVVDDAVTARVYRDLHAELPAHSAAMLGNLWRIGAVAAWADDLGGATSRQKVNPRAVSGIPTGPALTRRDAWYHLDLNPDLGREVFAEICLCMASILAGYSPQVWENPYVIPRRGKLRIIECEAAGYIAAARLASPPRETGTDWVELHADSHAPLPEGFRWDLVLRTAARVEDLLRGDAAPVWVQVEAALDGDN